MADDSDYVAMTTQTETDDTDDNNYTDDSEFEIIDLEPRPRSMSSSMNFIIDDGGGDNSSESDYESVACCRHINLTEDEIGDIIIDVYELFDEYIESNVLELSSPAFYDQMFQFVTEVLLEEWIDADLCDEDQYFDIQYFVKEIYTSYVDFARVPSRSRPISATAITVNMCSHPPSSAIREQIHKLQQIPQPAQRTPEWYAFRNGLISASNAWKVFGSEAMRNSIIYEKCKCNDTTAENTAGRWVNVNSPMHWGVKYEPVSVMLYEKLTSAKIGEFGCIRHPKYPFIGASPDGINIDETSAHFGRMLEIKNIVNREITGIPKLEYWIQTQLQMETCDLDECDFFETRFIEYVDETAFYDDDRQHRGVILYFTKHGDVNATPIYRYLPLHINIDPQSIAEWINNTKHEIQREYETDHITHNSTIYWHLDEYSCVLIERNRPWFAAALPKIREMWDIIETERKTGYEHRAAKKRENAIHKILVSIEASSTSYIVNNMPLSNSICIVKLDT